MRENDPITSLFYELWIAENIGTTYDHKVIGTKESIGGMNEKLLKEYHSIFYSPNNSLFVTYGGVEFEHINAIVEKDLESLERKDVPVHEIGSVKRNPQSDTILELERDVDICNYINIIRNNKISKISDLAKTIVLNTLFSGGEGSVFNQELQIKRSLVSSFDFEFLLTKDYNISIFESSLPTENREEVLKIVTEVFEEPLRFLTKENFIRAQKYAYGSLIRSMEDVQLPIDSSLANIELQNLRHGTEYSQGELLKEIKKVSLDGLREFTEEFFSSTSRTEGYVIPKKSN